jgi:hypothetical protein
MVIQDPGSHVRNCINTIPFMEFCYRALAVVKVTYIWEGAQHKLTVTSACLPYNMDDPPSTTVLRDIVSYCATTSGNSSLGVMATNSTLYGGARGTTQEEKTDGIFGNIQHKYPIHRQ